MASGVKGHQAREDALRNVQAEPDHRAEHERDGGRQPVEKSGEHFRTVAKRAGMVARTLEACPAETVA